MRRARASLVAALVAAALPGYEQALHDVQCSAAIGDFLDSVPMGRGAFAAIPTEPQLLSICAACDEAELEAALDAEQLTSNSVCVHTQLPALLTSLKLTLRAFCTRDAMESTCGTGWLDMFQDERVNSIISGAHWMAGDVTDSQLASLLSPELTARVCPAFSNCCGPTFAELVRAHDRLSGGGMVGMGLDKVLDPIRGLCKDGVAAARAFPPGDEPCADAMGLAKEADVINVSMPLVNGCAAAAVGSIRCANVCERALCASVPAAGDWPVDVDAGGAVVRQFMGEETAANSTMTMSRFVLAMFDASDRCAPPPPPTPPAPPVPPPSATVPTRGAWGALLTAAALLTLTL